MYMWSVFLVSKVMLVSKVILVNEVILLNKVILVKTGLRIEELFSMVIDDTCVLHLS
jgi:hypothetical protein